jgi:hypothetical protein
VIANSLAPSTKTITLLYDANGKNSGQLQIKRHTKMGFEVAPKDRGKLFMTSLAISKA